MTRGKYRNRNKNKGTDNSTPEPITDSCGEKENPTDMSDRAPDKPNERPPSTIGEIVIAIFVAITAGVYIVLTCVTLSTFHADQRAWLASAMEGPSKDAFKQGLDLTADAILRNIGKTPTRKVTYQFFACIPQSAEEIDFEYNDSSTCTGIRGFTNIILPGLDVTIQARDASAPLKLSDEQSNDILGGDDM